jgi:hypothetical protein
MLFRRFSQKAILNAMQDPQQLQSVWHHIATECQRISLGKYVKLVSD